MLIVGEDASHFSGGHENVFGLGFAIEFIDGGFVEEIELRMAPANDRGKALFVEFAPDSAANQPAMAGNIDSGFALHWTRR